MIGSWVCLYKTITCALLFYLFVYCTTEPLGPCGAVLKCSATTRKPFVAAPRQLINMAQYFARSSVVWKQAKSQLELYILSFLINMFAKLAFQRHIKKSLTETGTAAGDSPPPAAKCPWPVHKHVTHRNNSFITVLFTLGSSDQAKK